MGFLTLFSKKKNLDEKSVTTSSSRSSDGTKKSKKKRSSKSKKHASSSDLSDGTQPAVEVQLTENEKIISEYLKLLNNHGDVEDMLKFFASPEVRVSPDGGPGCSALEFASVLRACYQSFKDMSFDGHSVKEVKPDVVLLEDNVVTGTHTGAPYQPLPDLQPVEASGKYVVLDPERVYFKMKEGKIAKMEVIALGSNTGVTGLYMLAGGKLD